jgi:hypothetical protein
MQVTSGGKVGSSSIGTDVFGNVFGNALIPQMLGGGSQQLSVLDDSYQSASGGGTAGARTLEFRYGRDESPLQTAEYLYGRDDVGTEPILLAGYAGPDDVVQHGPKYLRPEDQIDSSWLPAQGAGIRALEYDQDSGGLIKHPFTPGQAEFAHESMARMLGSADVLIHPNTGLAYGSDSYADGEFLRTAGTGQRNLPAGTLTEFGVTGVPWASSGITPAPDDISPKGRDAYSPDRPGWHEYRETNMVCRPELNCTREEIVDQLSRHAVPGQDPSKPIESGQIYTVWDTRFPVQYPGGRVLTEVSDDGLTTTNTTLRLPQHILADGQIVRTAYQASDGAWYVTTHGYGNNVIPGMATVNANQGPLIFRHLDTQMRENIERHHGDQR